MSKAEAAMYSVVAICVVAAVFLFVDCAVKQSQSCVDAYSICVEHHDPVNCGRVSDCRVK